MDSDHYYKMETHKRSSLLLGCMLFVCFLIIGCDSRRDIVTDPAMSPIIVPFDLSYDAQTGRVVLDWEYLGVEPPARFRLLRVEREGIHFLNWQDLPDPIRAVDERADVWDVEPVADMELNAGEKYAYIMRTETVFNRPSEASFGQVQIPGARLEDVILAPEKSTATIVWHLPMGVPQKLELVRESQDETPPVIYTLSDLSDTIFVDVLPKGNANYRYLLRNTMDHGVVLESRAYVLEAYQQFLPFQESEPSDTHVFLTPSMSFSSDVLALIATEEFISVRDLGISGYIINPFELPVKNRTQLNLRSLSLAVTPIGKPQFSRRLLAGIMSESRNVQLSAFVFDDGVFVEVPWQYTDWVVDNVNLPTAIFVGPDGIIWVGVGQMLRAFASEGEGVVEVGKLDLNLSGDIQGLVAFDSGLWFVTTDGQVWKSSASIDLNGGLSSLFWEQVLLPVDAYPISVSGNAKTVFVLDQAQGRVLAFDFDGQLGLWWQGLDGLDLNRGGLAISRTGDAYVWDAQNQMVSLKMKRHLLKNFLIQKIRWRI